MSLVMRMRREFKVEANVEVLLRGSYRETFRASA